MNTSNEGNQDAGKSPERLEHEVDQARARLGQRLDTLSDRLSPGELLDQAMHMAREHGGEFGHNLGSQVKQNPLPLILTGVGISWMMMSSNSKRSNTVVHTYGTDTPGTSTRGKIKDSVSHTADRAHELKGSAADHLHAAQSSMHDATSSLQYRARSSQQQLTDFLHEQPVLAASLGMALGAALGAMLPHTETEDRVLGSASEEAVAKVRSEASKQYEKAQGVAQEAVQGAKETVRDNSSAGSHSTPSTGSTGYQPDSGRV